MKIYFPWCSYCRQIQWVLLQEAVETGKQMMYRSHLEELLGNEIIMEIAVD